MSFPNKHLISGSVITDNKIRGLRKSSSTNSKDISPNKCSGDEAARETDHPGKQKGSNLPATVGAKLPSLKKEVCVTAWL